MVLSIDAVVPVFDWMKHRRLTPLPFPFQLLFQASVLI
jgi:hypothetical protein